MTDFRDVARDLAPRGGWLRDNTSQAYLGALGGAVSDSLALWREGVKVRFASTCPADGLVHLGDTRQVERAPREPEADYRTRLRRAFEIHGKRGTSAAWAEILAPLGVEEAAILVRDDWQDSVIPAPPGTDPWWSRVIVIVDCTSGPWSAPVWDDGAVWSDSEVWGIEGMTQGELAWMRRQIRRWKWAGAFPLAMVLIFGGAVWGLETVWSEAVWSDDPASVAVIPLGRVWGFEEAVYGAPQTLWADSAVWQDPFTF